MIKFLAFGCQYNYIVFIIHVHVLLYIPVNSLKTYSLIGVESGYDQIN
jgi:hypothetical protein